MSDENKTYTYRGGEKVELEKSTDEIVVRALPAALDDASIVGIEQVSSASTKIEVSNTELEGLMDKCEQTRHLVNKFEHKMGKL